MENLKNFLIILICLFLSSCSLFDGINKDGWEYVGEKDYSRALSVFREDYSSFPDSVEIVSGLAYTYFIYEQNDSAFKYLKESETLSAESDYTLFVTILYYRYSDYAKASSAYRTFVSKYNPSFNLYVINDVIRTNSMHKMGLSVEYLREDYQYVYDVLKVVSSISDSLDITTDENRFLMIEYINQLEE